MASVSFDSGCVVQVTPLSIYVMTEMYCNSQGATGKDFNLTEPVTVDSVWGTLSFQGLNWSWWRKLSKPNTAICGWVGAPDSPLIVFDFQGNGQPQMLPVKADFPGGVTLDKLHFELYVDLTLPTDFRVALAFHRKLS